MSWAEDQQALKVAILSQTLPAVEERLDKVDPVLSEADSANKLSIEEKLDLAMDTLNLIINDTNANINSSPAPRIKDLARILRLAIRDIRRDYRGAS